MLLMLLKTNPATRSPLSLTVRERETERQREGEREGERERERRAAESAEKKLVDILPETSVVLMSMSGSQVHMLKLFSP